ncbi:MAG: 50S ribosomal protein L24 [Candidatus Saccharimonadales bacterium]
MIAKYRNQSTKLYKIRLKKGDTVQVLAGKDKGRTGKVLATHPSENKVTVEGINIAKKHQKPNKAYPQGGIIELTRPIWVSKVGIVDPSTKKPSRIGYKLDGKGGKVRVYKASGKEISLTVKAKEVKK